MILKLDLTVGDVKLLKENISLCKSNICSSKLTEKANENLIDFCEKLLEQIHVQVAEISAENDAIFTLTEEYFLGNIANSENDSSLFEDVIEF